MNYRPKILITGVAGFVGFHLAKRLSDQYDVFGIDNINNYYDQELKINRLLQLGFYRNQIEEALDDVVLNDSGRISFFNLDIASSKAVSDYFNKLSFDYVVHLAGQAGVRYSIDNPQAYIDSNITGFLNILEAVKIQNVKHLLFASSSSVYGMSPKSPFSEIDIVDKPVSFYAVTKRTNELMAYTYSNMYNIPLTALRFFTVYGPWGRPDMAPMLFAKAIIKGDPIKVFNDGQMLRDFTYVDDIVESISRLVLSPPGEGVHDKNMLSNNVEQAQKFRVLNIGNSSPVSLMDFIECLEDTIGKKAVKKFLPMQPGDVLVTYSDSRAIYDLTGFRPQTTISEGVKKFIEWYLLYYSTN